MGESGAAGSSGAGELFSLLDRFDRAWRAESPPRIDEFLTPVPDVPGAGDEAVRRQRLEELIKVDLEHRWRRARGDPAGPWVPGSGEAGPQADLLPVCPLLEDYLFRYRELGPLDRLSPALVGEEYRVRHRWGDGPGHAEYATRFAALGSALDATLTAVDAELATNLECSSSAPPADRSASTVHAPPRFSCPHCCASIDPGPGGWPEILDCPACGGSIAIEVPGPGARPPFARLGRYVLGELLGAGGFGSVWRARDEELRREVAVKVPRGEFLGGRAREERFLREARSAAHLQHRGIVTVHDSGRDQGTVYIVSELVHGPSLAQWLQRGRLSFRETAELAVQVADALDHAHRHGVVHRDLKPSNILLDSDQSDGRGQTGAARSPAPAAEPTSWNLPAFHPRIVDFGLAKHDAGEATMTFDGQVLGTLAHMSPEQLRSSHDVDGRSDVYSLGVVLYQLLTHELPFRGVTRMLQVQMLEDEPSSPRQLNDRVPRDLETITLKCLAKEPARRYASAGELAEDLRRFLAGEPIRARPVSRFERLRVWCRRNPIAATFASGLVLTFLAGFAGVTWQWLRAEANFRTARSESERAEGNLAQAREIVKEMYTQFAEQLDREGKLPKYQRQILEKALQFYETTALPQSRDPDVRLAAGQASARVAFIRETLGDMDKAEAAYRRCLELLDALVAEYPDVPDYVRSLAVVHFRLGDFYGQTNRSDPAVLAHHESVALRKRLVADHPEVVRYQSELADCYNNLANDFGTVGRMDEAVTIHRKNVAIYEALVLEHPQDHNLRASLMRGLMNVGLFCKAAGRAQEAKAAYRRAVGLAETLTEGQPGVSQDHHELLFIYRSLGEAQAEIGQLSSAVASLSDCLGRSL